MSESEEMYLVSIYTLVEEGTEKPVPLSQIASELNFQPVSVNQMVRKLEETGKVTYTPYKGVELTPTGEEIALKVLRHRRLWEVFLVDQLKISPDVASDIACRMEHIIPEDAADRMAAFLGYPTTSPNGRSIPGNRNCDTCPAGLRLSQSVPGQQLMVLGVESDAATRAFLSSENILPGARLTIIIGGTNGGCLVQTGTGRVFLPAEICNEIWVSP